jgi:phage terminase small subunit
MGLPKKLTEMQMKFAYEIVTNEGRKTGTECAIDAGYEKDCAVVTASKLQNPKLYPLVVQYIGELRAEYQKKYDVTFERHITELAKLRDSSRDKGAWSAAINAEVARGKAAGLYIEQKIIRTGKLEDLSADELENRLKEIMEDYKPLLEGVEVKDLEEDVKSRQKKIRLGKPQQPKKKEVITVDYSSSSSSSSSEESQSSESSEPESA